MSRAISYDWFARFGIFDKIPLKEKSPGGYRPWRLCYCIDERLFRQISICIDEQIAYGIL